MTRAAEQCREYVEYRWPGTPISRFACRDTAAGGISQHSAYDGYDSNAIDIFGPDKGTGVRDQAYVQTIVDDLAAHEDEWSIRKILWRDGGAHENHAHVDFYPMITMHKWCGGPETPTWEYSDDSTTTTRDPEPENGLYNGANYRGVFNVPNKDYARDIIDLMLELGIINVSDSFADDWLRDQMTDGRYWNFTSRLIKALDERYT